MYQQGKELAEGLRQIADFYEANPELPLFNDVLSLVCYADKQMFMEYAKALKTFNKEIGSTDFRITKQFGLTKMSIIIARNQVCVAKKVGTKKVTKQVVAEYKTEIVDEDILEWECPSLLKLQGQEITEDNSLPTLEKQIDDMDIPF